MKRRSRTPTGAAMKRAAVIVKTGPRKPPREPKRSAKAGRIPKRDRAKLRRRVKKSLGLTRRQIGAIEAGNLEPPPGYVRLVFTRRGK